VTWTFAVLLPWLSCCTVAHFVTQGTLGQLDLATSARPIAEVIADAKTEERTRMMLGEVLLVKAFGSRHGLSMHENYEEFVQLDRPFVVWFVNASEPLAFLPKTFTFPVVGSFPGLSWFDEQDARDFADDLREDGWDVNVRGVSAYSTGGWFDDPILSSMFEEERGGLGYLVNLVLHESFHATVLVPDQQYFNESAASFVADELAPIYLRERFGRDSLEVDEYLTSKEENRVAIETLAYNVALLNAVYNSGRPDAWKYEFKARILGDLQARLQFPELPNNATLIGFALYHEGKEELRRLRQVCGSWPAFIAAVGSLTKKHFPEEQSPSIGPTVDLLTHNGCRPFPRDPYRSFSRPQREQQRRLSSRLAAEDDVKP
jgi:predicted aminopeptidase